jgi:hypothetical protein
MLETGATHVGVATDHVIESFRNDLWAGYKTGDGIEPALWRSSIRSRRRSRRWASSCGRWSSSRRTTRSRRGALAAARPARREGLHLDAGQGPRAVRRGDRVVQVDAARKPIRDEAGVREKFGVAPALIPDWLALVGDAADGYPGISGIGPSARRGCCNRWGPIESFPPEELGERRELALPLQGPRARCGRTRRCSTTWRRCAGPAPRIVCPRGRRG